jgi:putative FmdB family regulatory protein
MPIYEYRCERGHTFEAMQRMTDDPLTSCSTCDAPAERVFHPVAVHFKGSGFYTTDYGRKKSASSDSAPKADSGDSKDSGVGGTKESKASDSKGSDSKAS